MYSHFSLPQSVEKTHVLKNLLPCYAPRQAPFTQPSLSLSQA